MESITFYHTLPIQLRFNDVDKFGHVNNTAYFMYYDLGKAEYFTSVYPQFDLHTSSVVVVHIEVDFMAQIFGMDNIAVQTAVIEIGTKSMTLLQQVVDTKTSEVKCRCTSVLVAFDLKAQQAIEIPEEWKEAICAFEHRELRKRK